VELRHTAKDVDFVNVVAQVRRTIWRVFGVLPVEMGASEDIPRAVGQVQLEVAGSHLINPILELIEAKVNARILPLVTGDPTAPQRLRFRFDRESKLSAQDQKDMAQTLVNLVREGLLTRNEARAIRGDAPVDGGDVVTLTTGQGVFPLANVLGSSPATGVPTTSPSSPPPGSTGDGGGSEPEPPPERGGPGGGGDATVEPHPHPHPHPGEARAVMDEDLPSAWQSPGPFSNVRTMDLTELFDAVTEYTRIVRPLYAKAADEATAAVRAMYRPGKLDEEAADRLLARINASLDKLEREWAIATESVYMRAARVGMHQARDMTGLPVLDNWRSIATQYGERAIRFLCDPGGLIADLRTRAVLMVSVLTSRSEAEQAERAASHNMFNDLQATVSVDIAAEAMIGGFAAEHYRITNWSGRLVELANNTLVQGALAAGTVLIDGRPQATEWWVEWVAVNDRGTCPTCAFESVKGLQPLNTLTAVPGGDTECQANCRCVLVMWTKGEVDSGQAFRLG
jgi:hypothetical protein